ncbi:MAG: glycosyltransferase [Bacteroidetes bacterium]|nr:MAG: glycosyltransferase [Bacteroidota bacterium]
MHIIHLILGKARPERMNGVSKVAHQLALHQAELGYEVSLWGITPSLEDMPPRAYGLRLFQARRNKLRLDPELRAALRSLQGQEAVVHLHGGFIPEFYLAARLLRRVGVPYVFSPHGALSPFAFDRGGRKKRLYFRLFESEMIRHARGIHFLGQIQYDAADRLMPMPHKVLIPNGQDQAELLLGSDPAPREAVPVFSYCGRLIIHYKGLDQLLAGFIQYRKEGGQGLLWLIGDGPDRARLEAQAAKGGVSAYVRFWGSQYGEEKFRLLRSSDAFFHPSRSEGFPTGVLEAAGAGLPCVVTTETNAASYLVAHQAGLHLPDIATGTIARAMHEVDRRREDGSLARMGGEAARMVREDFSWSHIAQRMIAELYA